MNTEKELLKQEAKQKWHCPVCQGLLHKNKKGTKKENVLSLGIRCCHDCESTWFMQKIGR